MDNDPAKDSTSLDELVSRALDAMWVIDEDDIVHFMNPAAVQLSGFGADQLIGAPLAQIMPPEIAKHHLEYIKGYIAAGATSLVLGKIRELEIVTRSGETVAVELRAFEIGASGGKRRFGAVMPDISARKAAEASQHELLEKMRRLAYEDELTGLPNRRSFFDTLEREVSATNRHGHPACVGVVDIDHFKRINDTHGDDAGDRVLAAIAKIMTVTMRIEDVIARVGGGEFAILLPDTEIGPACIALERVLENVRRTPIMLRGDVSLSLTVSAGVAAIAPDSNGAHCLRTADIALLRAKETGRDRLCATADDIAPKSAAE